MNDVYLDEWREEETGKSLHKVKKCLMIALLMTGR